MSRQSFKFRRLAVRTTVTDFVNLGLSCGSCWEFYTWLIAPFISFLKKLFIIIFFSGRGTVGVYHIRKSFDFLLDRVLHKNRLSLVLDACQLLFHSYGVVNFTKSVRCFSPARGGCTILLYFHLHARILSKLLFRVGRPKQQCSFYIWARMHEKEFSRWENTSIYSSRFSCRMVDGGGEGRLRQWEGGGKGVNIPPFIIKTFKTNSKQKRCFETIKIRPQTEEKYK